MRRELIKSTTRTLEILELFNNERKPLKLTYIYRVLSYPQSSTTALLKSMVATGYLNYDMGKRTYFPTSRVAALGDWINCELYQNDVLDVLQEVFEKTNEVVGLSSQNDIFVQHVRALRPADYGRTSVVNKMRVLPRSASGMVLLSQMPTARVEKLMRLINVYERHSWDLKALHTHLQVIRTQGYCLLAASPYKFASVIAMALPRDPDGFQMTLSVGGENGRIVRRKSEILEVMRAAIGRYAANGAA